jgi:hypothetical protein
MTLMSEQPTGHPVELFLESQGSHFTASFADGHILLNGTPEIWLDLAPYLIARALLDQGYDPQRIVVVRLRGDGHVVAHGETIAVLAATPFPNRTTPVRGPIRCIYRDQGIP